MQKTNWPWLGFCVWMRGNVKPLLSWLRLPRVWAAALVALAQGTGLALAAPVAASDGSTFVPLKGRPEVLLNGKPAPPASSAVCGFVLVAGAAGPQVAFTEKPSTAVMALEAGEDARWSAVFKAPPGSITVTAEVEPLEPCQVEVALTLNGGDSCRVRLSGDRVLLTATAPAHAGEIAVRLEAAASSKTAAVRWRNVRLIHEKGEAVIGLFPGGANVDACPPRVLPALRPPMEQALIEWDWRMQDGIGTERAPATLCSGCREAPGTRRCAASGFRGQGLPTGRFRESAGRRCAIGGSS